MSTTKKLYEVLGLKSSASADEIRKKYRKLARTYHPDVNPGDRVSEERFKEVASAYEVLSNKDKRKAYDEFGDESLKGGFDPEQARAYEQWQTRRQRTGGQATPEYFNLEDLFGGAYGGSAYASARGADIYAVAELNLAQVVGGTEVSIMTPGSNKPTRVRIPAGADTGDKIRLQGLGGPGMGSGAAGDLVIETRVKPHPQVKRSGLNLTLRIPITLSEAYNGSSIDVPTFSGSVRVTVPAHSQNGAKLRLRGKGISRKKKKGDFLVELEVHMPTEENEALAEALRKSDDLYDGSLRSEVRL